MMKNSKKIQQKDKDKNINGRNESLSSALRNDIKTGAEKSIGSQEIPVPEKIRMLVSIVERGHGKTLIEWFGKNGVTYHYRCHGHGTASSDMMDILGLGSSEKDIVISLSLIHISCPDDNTRASALPDASEQIPRLCGKLRYDLKIPHKQGDRKVYP